jgi:hypothetical protein
MVWSMADHSFRPLVESSLVLVQTEKICNNELKFITFIQFKIIKVLKKTKYTTYSHKEIYHIFGLYNFFFFWISSYFDTGSVNVARWYFWVLMYMHMLSRFGKQYSAIYEHDMYTVNIWYISPWSYDSLDEHTSIDI